MRRFWLVLIVAALALAVSSAHLTAQTQDPDHEDDAPALPETLGKLTLTLDDSAHAGGIRKVLFTADGKQIITLSLDNAIRLVDAVTGEPRKVLRVPGFGGLRVAALSPDGGLLAVASRYREGDKTNYVVYLLTIPDGAIERVLHGHTGAVHSLGFSADGKRLASGADDGSTRIWSPAKDQAEQVLKTTSKHKGLSLSPDGNRLARNDDNGCSIIDLASAKVVAQLPFPRAKSPFLAVAWSPDGKLIATAGPDGGTSLWKPDGTQQGRLGNGRSVRFSADSRTVLVTLGAPHIRHYAAIFDVVTGKQLVQFKHLTALKAFDGDLSPDGQLAVTTGGKLGLHSTYVWQPSNGALVQKLATRKWLNSKDRAGWSADGKAVTWSKDRSFHLGELQMNAGLEERDYRGPQLQQGTRTLRIVDRASAAVEVVTNNVADARLSLGPDTEWQAMTFVGKDNVVLAGTSKDGGQLVQYEAATGRVLHRFHRTSAGMYAVAPSPNGRFFISVSEDQRLRIWSLDQDKELLSLYVSGSDWIAWTPEGYYAASPGGERIRGWTLDNGIDKAPTYYPADRFRKRMFRPDVIKLLLEKGNLKDALETANAALQKEGHRVAEGVANLETLLPPQVSLRIVDATKLPQVTVQATALAASKDQPILGLRLLVDGRPLPGGAGSAEFDPGVLKAEKSWTITLPGAKPTAPYRLSVLARSPDASGISAPVEVTFIDKAKLPALHVLAVGVNGYQDESLKLQFAVADARALAEAFTRSAKTGGLFTQAHATLLVDGDARRDRVLAALADIRARAKSNDLVVVSFACHGVKDKNGFYLLPVEARTDDLAKTALPGDVLRRTLADFPCQVLLLLDACHSAGFGAGRKLAKLGLRPATDDATRAMTDDEVGVAVLCAAMGHEKAEEKDGNGLFTKAIVQALSGAPGVPQRNHKLYVHHLHTYVLDTVSDRSNERQHPFLSLPWIVESFPVTQFAGSMNPAR